MPAPAGPDLAIEPLAGPLDATVEVPGSKSITNRALVCAALASGSSTLRGALLADDTEAMIGCLGALGATVDARWDAGSVEVSGLGGRWAPEAPSIDARMSGTTARFVLPLLAFAPRAVELTGHPQLLARPMGSAIEALRQLDVEVVELGRSGHLPVRVGGSGGLTGGTIELAGDVSSQFLSGLLLAAPAMRGGIAIRLSTDLVSRPYVDLTGGVMAAFGASVEVAEGGRRFTVAGGGYQPADFSVEPDASAATYFFAAAAVLGGRVRVQGLGAGSLQGDLRFVEVLSAMGCEVTVGDGFTDVRGTGTLRGVEVDLADLSDAAPTLAAVAAFAATPTRATGIGFIRHKESDRIAAIVAELRRCGVAAEEEPDGFVVRPDPGGPTGARIETYGDHRMAMSFAVVGLRVPGVVVVDPGCVAKTFPGFFETIDRLR